jgi:hypothetical protein
VAHERLVEAPHPLVGAVAAVQVAHVAAVFAMDAHRHAGGPGGYLHLQRREIAAVHDGRAQLAEQAVQARIQPEPMARRLLQRDELHIAATHALAEISDFGQRQHRMTVGGAGHVVDEVDHPVFQAARIETVDDMQDQGTCIGRCAGYDTSGLDGLHVRLLDRAQRRQTL